MKRLALIVLIFLAGCATYRAAEGEVSFVAQDGVLLFVSNTDANISHGAALVKGEIASKLTVYNEGQTYVLELPESLYGRSVRVGTYTGPVSGEATIVLSGAREGLETPLEVR